MAEGPSAFSKDAEPVEEGGIRWFPTPVVGEPYGVATARSDATGQEVRNRLRWYCRIDVDEEVARKTVGLLAAADGRVGAPNYPVFFIPAAMPLTVSRRVRSSSSVRWVRPSRFACSRFSGST